MRISDWSSDVCSSDLWPSCWSSCPPSDLPFVQAPLERHDRLGLPRQYAVHRSPHPTLERPDAVGTEDAVGPDAQHVLERSDDARAARVADPLPADRKSTRLNSSH